MSIEITTKIRIQGSENYWYTVEDRDIDSDVNGGCTISYENVYDDVSIYIKPNSEEALAIADAIYKLFKKPSIPESIYD